MRIKCARYLLFRSNRYAAKSGSIFAVNGNRYSHVKCERKRIKIVIKGSERLFEMYF